MKEEILGRINGFLYAFGWINTKTNHGYTFQISLLPHFENYRDSIEYYVKNCLRGTEEPVLHVTDRGADWQSILNKYMKEWLFQFQIDTYENGFCLMDKNKEFSLTHDAFKDDMLAVVFLEFEKLGEFTGCYEVEIAFEKMYYGTHNDILMIAKDSALYVHFGLSD